jgi:hypothetical protein
VDHADMTDMAISQPVGGFTRVLGSRRDSVSFGDVVLARFEARLPTANTEAHEKHVDLLARFKEQHGEIVDDFYADTVAAGVAVTCKRRLFSRDQLTLHRRTERLTVGHPSYSSLLLQLDGQAVRVSNVLAGMSQRIAMSNLFALARDVIATLGSSQQPGKATRDQHWRNLEEMRDYVGLAGTRQAQIVYLQGVMWGLAWLFVLTPLLAWVLSAFDVPGIDPTLFVACLVAGAFGAAMSVLMRLNGGRGLKVSHEIGREYVTNLGLARPIIGAIFALLLYFASRGELLEQMQLPEGPKGQLAFFVAAGFLVGFSERLAKEIVNSAEGSLPGAPSQGSSQ